MGRPALSTSYKSSSLAGARHWRAMPRSSVHSAAPSEAKLYPTHARAEGHLFKPANTIADCTLVQPRHLSKTRGGGSLRTHAKPNLGGGGGDLGVLRQAVSVRHSFPQARTLRDTGWPVFRRRHPGGLGALVAQA